MPEATETKQRPQRATTTIRPVSLDRLNLVLPYLPRDEQVVTDAISTAVDRFVRTLVKKHNITLPPELAFSTTE